MKIFFLHLSDFHFRRDTNPILNRTKQIAAALGSVDSIADACIVSATGDITYSGQRTEFDIADRFFTSLRTELSERYGQRNVKFLIIPGNHDCDFSQDSQPRADILDDLYRRLNKISLDDSTLRRLLAVQAEFFRFASKWMNAPADPWVFCEDSLPFNGVNVHARCYNTAFASQLPEQQGKLVFPLHLAPSDCAKADPHSITIALLHHPYHWLESNNGIALRSHLDSVADLVLTGHQHVESSYSKRNMAGEEVTYFEGAALQVADSADSGFYVVLSDLKEQQLRRFQFRWNGEVYELTQSDAWAPFPRKRARVRFELDPDYRALLSDPGTGFTHPRKTKLTLEDIFICPDVSKLSLGKNVEGRDIPEVVKSNDVIDFLLRHDKVFISAGDRAGKTRFRPDSCRKVEGVFS